MAYKPGWLIWGTSCRGIRQSLKVNPFPGENAKIQTKFNMHLAAEKTKELNLKPYDYKHPTLHTIIVFCIFRKEILAPGLLL
jgi:hypothetical protein